MAQQFCFQNHEHESMSAITATSSSLCQSIEDHLREGVGSNLYTEGSGLDMKSRDGPRQAEEILTTIFTEYRVQMTKVKYDDYGAYWFAKLTRSRRRVSHHLFVAVSVTGAKFACCYPQRTHVEHTVQAEMPYVQDLQLNYLMGWFYNEMNGKDRAWPRVEICDSHGIATGFLDDP